ncbi:MAG: DUF1217 domain-containing protein [Pararhodobacter sp.]|nr:DUF1217 domain-containing protein [Pararhodobacter sp.]
MSFQPVIPANGYAGWSFLQRTLERQSLSHSGTAMAKADEAYFRENIGKISSAEELVNDRRLLRVALTSFGLADDLQNRAFIRKVLESSTREPEAGERRSFVQRLADKRYHDLAKAFGFGDSKTSETPARNASDSSLSRQEQAQQLTRSMQNDLSVLAGSELGEQATWTLVLTTPSLRSMFETVFDLSGNFADLDVNRQIEILREKTQEVFGRPDVAQFAQPDRLHQLGERYIEQFAGNLVSNFHQRRFEEAVGAQDQSMRLALSLQRDLAQLAQSDQSENGKWFRILGTPSMRTVFETALQLPSTFGSLDLDRQADILRTRSQRAFGDSGVSQFAHPEVMNKLVRQFFVGEQLNEIRTISSQSAALTLLQGAQANMAAFRRLW